MWIVIFNALDDFGIRELNDVVRAGSPDSEHPNYSNIEVIKKKISEDALHGALRIAGLVRLPTLHYPDCRILTHRAGWCIDLQWLPGAPASILSISA